MGVGAGYEDDVRRHLRTEVAEGDAVRRQLTAELVSVHEQLRELEGRIVTARTIISMRGQEIDRLNALVAEMDGAPWVPTGMTGERLRSIADMFRTDEAYNPDEAVSWLHEWACMIDAATR